MNAPHDPLGYLRFLHQPKQTHNEWLSSLEKSQIIKSGLPVGKTLGTLDEARLPKSVRRQLPSLLNADLVQRGDYLLCFGRPGLGKSHLAAALGREWIQRHKLKVLFIPALRLIGQLLVAKRELKLTGAMTKLAQYDAVIIDDLGYMPYGKDETDVLFTLLAERHGKRSVVFTSNFGFSHWDQIFTDPTIALNQIVHRAIVLDFTFELQRLHAARPPAKPLVRLRSTLNDRRSACHACKQTGSQQRPVPGLLSPASDCLIDA